MAVRQVVAFVGRWFVLLALMNIVTSAYSGTSTQQPVTQ